MSDAVFIPDDVEMGKSYRRGVTYDGVYMTDYYIRPKKLELNIFK